MSEEPPPRAPSRDDYEYGETAGEGAYGQAIIATDKATGEKVVIKAISLGNLTPQQVEDVYKETKILSMMHHPNIIGYRCSFIEKNVFHIVMEYADGGDLSQKIQDAAASNTLFDEEQILAWFVQICLAVKHCHNRKVLHRDLKTQNVFLMKDGTVKLGDFGIAKTLDQTAQMVQTAIGTPYYLSPEICQGKKYNAKSDIWSLGVILYELCTLKHPFDANNINALVTKIVRSKPSPISKDYSLKLRKLVEELLKKTPSNRPDIKKLLEKDILKSRIGKFLAPEEVKAEFSHTTFHGCKAGEEPAELPTAVEEPEQRAKSPKSSGRSRLPVRTASRGKALATKPTTAKSTGSRSGARQGSSGRPIRTPAKPTKEDITKQKNASVRADRAALAEEKRKKEEEKRLRDEKEAAKRDEMRKRHEARQAHLKMEKERMSAEAKAGSKKYANLESGFKKFKNQTQEAPLGDASDMPKDTSPRPQTRPANEKEATGRPNFLKKRTQEEDDKLRQVIKEARENRKKEKESEGIEIGGISITPETHEEEEQQQEEFNFDFDYDYSDDEDEMKSLAIMSQNLDEQEDEDDKEEPLIFDGKPLELPKGDLATRREAIKQFITKGLGEEKYEAVLKLVTEQAESEVSDEEGLEAIFKLLTPDERKYLSLIQKTYMWFIEAVDSD